MDKLKKNPYEEAQEFAEHYLDVKKKKAELDGQMKTYKSLLEAFANENPQLFEDNKLDLGTGVLRYGEKSTVKLNKRKWSIEKALEAIPEYLSVSLPVAMVKKAITSDEGKKKMSALGVSISREGTFHIEEA